MSTYINDFIKNGEKRNLSKNTLEAYKRDLVKYEDFLSTRKEDFISSDEVSVMAFVQHLRSLNKANSSIVRIIVTLRVFYKYLVNKNIVDQSPLFNFENPKSKRNMPRILSVEEVDKLLNMPDGSTLKGIRDKAMLEVMYATGMKTTELINLKISDVNLKLSYIRCKNNKFERIIPIGSYASNCIEEYLKVRPEINFYKSEDLFFNLKGKKISRQGFWKIIKEYSAMLNIEKQIDSNILRHSFAVHLLQNGADIKSIQELLGHTTITSTQIYSSVSKKSKIMDVYKNAHPRA
ncbi:site-specific tyrosine recombinase [Clostridium grantii]|uniref:Integrase/recombinase XerD n=1 Tax=Clostridium grantii DSM 8605 TaxID=1121316 RepID=A0A1M5SCV5_9CLOT|nr:site-specific tyrosine recombinase [Clostridium grantii]SHH35733.1 integrase/recombinase XerD [Clostridium grantii DSM 8605]